MFRFYTPPQRHSETHIRKRDGQYIDIIPTGTHNVGVTKAEYRALEKLKLPELGSKSLPKEAEELLTEFMHTRGVEYFPKPRIFNTPAGFIDLFRPRRTSYVYGICLGTSTLALATITAPLFLLAAPFLGFRNFREFSAVFRHGAQLVCHERMANSTSFLSMAAHEYGHEIGITLCGDCSEDFANKFSRRFFEYIAQRYAP